MSDSIKPEDVAVEVGVKDGLLTCKIPMLAPDGDLNKSKITVYGALKLAEEQASIYFMQQQMKRRQGELLKAGQIPKIIH